jgi:hypothetical protein
MTTIYHVTPITPNSVLESLAGRALMVRWRRHDQVQLVERIAAAIAYDNGAFGFFKKARAMSFDDWRPFYAWLEPRLYAPGRWAIIPDVIGEGGQIQDALIREWPFGKKGAPVWHTDEPIARLLRLIDHWPRVCIGSTGEHWRIWKEGRAGVELDPIWQQRMDEVWSVLAKRRHLPVIHMLRGTAVAHLYPFHSADSSSVGQNAHRHRKRPLALFTDKCGAVDYADKLEARARA